MAYQLFLPTAEPCTNGTRKYKTEIVIGDCDLCLCYIFNTSVNPHVTQTVQCVLWWLQHIGQIISYS
jgi:hypothetical protein